MSAVVLTQGDLIPDCPIITWLETNSVGGASEEVLRALTQAVRADVVVMTQACDLAHGKVENVILCPHYSLQDFKQLWQEAEKAKGQNPSEKAWKKYCDAICDGSLWNLSMLNTEAGGGLSVDHRVVDFHHVYTVPRAFIESLVRSRGTDRIRLRAPYREHLSQAFARFFMRVGLPVNVAKAW